MWRDNQFGPPDKGFRGLPTERTDDPAPFVVNDPRVGGNLTRIRWIEPADGCRHEGTRQVIARSAARMIPGAAEATDACGGFGVRMLHKGRDGQLRDLGFYGLREMSATDWTFDRLVDAWQQCPEVVYQFGGVARGPAALAVAAPEAEPEAEPEAAAAAAAPAAAAPAAPAPSRPTKRGIKRAAEAAELAEPAAPAAPAAPSPSARPSPAKRPRTPGLNALQDLLLGLYLDRVVDPLEPMRPVRLDDVVFGAMWELGIDRSLAPANPEAACAVATAVTLAVRRELEARDCEFLAASDGTLLAIGPGLAAPELRGPHPLLPPSTFRDTTARDHFIVLRRLFGRVASDPSGADFYLVDRRERVVSRPSYPSLDDVARFTELAATLRETVHVMYGPARPPLSVGRPAPDGLLVMSIVPGPDRTAAILDERALFCVDDERPVIRRLRSAADRGWIHPTVTRVFRVIDELDR
jgi:hypothetical protein